MCRASATAVMSELSSPRDDGYMPAYAGLAKSDADVAVARVLAQSWSWQAL